MVIGIIHTFVCFIFLSGSETALTAANRMKIQTDAQGNKKAGKLSKLLTKPSNLSLQY